MSNVQQEIEIGLSSWIMQDGNYDNFESGQVAQFALEFNPHAIRPAQTNEKSLKCLGGAKYEVVGEVVYLSKKVWLLDFGLLAFQETEPPPGTTLGSYLAVNLYLGIDPFFYFEYLHGFPEMPPMIYSWKINSILQQTAPLVETTIESGHKILIRDEKKLGYKPIAKTDAWKDDNGHAEYVLNCTKLDVAPTFQITEET